MPPNMSILLRGTGVVLTLTSAVSVLAGVATMNPMVALNSTGFIGICALSLAAIFYSVALERIGLRAARTAAMTLVTALAASASFMALVFFALFTEARFRVEASVFGLHSIAGVVVLSLLVSVLVLVWRDR